MTGALSADEPSGEAPFLSKLDVIERVISFVSSRHHLPGVDADDFASHVKLKLIEDDYGILREFQGRSSLRSYLTVVIQRLFLDYRISAWGKWRPSAEAKRSGTVAVLLEQLIGRDGYGFDEACDLLETNHQVTVARAELAAIAGRLPVRLKRRFESGDALPHVPAGELSPDEPIAEREQAAAEARLAAALAGAPASLDPEDRLPPAAILQVQVDSVCVGQESNIRVFVDLVPIGVTNPGEAGVSHMVTVGEHQLSAVSQRGTEWGPFQRR